MAIFKYLNPKIGMILHIIQKDRGIYNLHSERYNKVEVNDYAGKYFISTRRPFEESPK